MDRSNNWCHPIPLEDMSHGGGNMVSPTMWCAGRHLHTFQNMDIGYTGEVTIIVVSIHRTVESRWIHTFQNYTWQKHRVIWLKENGMDGFITADLQVRIIMNFVITWLYLF